MVTRLGLVLSVLVVVETCYKYFTKEKNGIIFTREGTEVNLMKENLEGTTLTVQCVNSFEVSIKSIESLNFKL